MLNIVIHHIAGLAKFKAKASMRGIVFRYGDEQAELSTQKLVKSVLPSDSWQSGQQVMAAYGTY
ncbi:MAG TPA: hypothetical protein VFK07_01585 [Candidatus Paceibacterota bacterium]|nr:hypothetical protein [Candidatus Paceibacterota bacterium]